MKPEERQIAGVSSFLSAAWVILTPLHAMSPQWSKEGIALLNNATRAVKKALDYYDSMADELTEWKQDGGSNH